MPTLAFLAKFRLPADGHQKRQPILNHKVGLSFMAILAAKNRAFHPYLRIKDGLSRNGSLAQQGSDYWNLIPPEPALCCLGITTTFLKSRTGFLALEICLVIFFNLQFIRSIVG